MNTMKSAVACVLAVAGLPAMGETYSQSAELSGAEPIVIADGSELEFDVAAGATVTVSRVVSGTGKLVKSGGGTLVLAAENTFSGGIEFSAGDLRADCGGAFGSGTVTRTHKDAYCLEFNAPGAAFDNDIVLRGAGESRDVSARRHLHFSADTVLNGTIRCEGTDTRYIIGPAYKSAHEVVFNGDIVFDVGLLAFSSYGTMEFNGSVKTGRLTLYAASSATGKLLFRNPDNNLGNGGSVESYAPNIWCGASNAISNLLLRTRYNYTAGYPSHCIDLDGYDQTIKAVYSMPWKDSNPTLTVIAAPGDNQKSLCIRSLNKPATLTLKGEGAGKTSCSWHSFGDAISVVLDADPTYTLVLSNRTHSMKGGITVRSGTMKGVVATSFPNTERLTVASGAAFELSTSVEDALKSVCLLDVEGTLSIESPASQSMRNCDMSIGAGASVSLPESGPLTVKSLMVNGERMAAGTYGHDAVPQIRTGSIKVEPLWPELVEPVYTFRTVNGATNAIDEMTVTVTEDGETREVQFSTLAKPASGTVRKVGDGVILSSERLSDFTGQILVEEGAFAVNDNLQTGPTNASEAADVWVKDGASFILTGTADTCGAAKLRLYNRFHLAGAGYNGMGVLRNDLNANQNYCFYESELHLNSDIAIGVNSRRKRCAVAHSNVYMNRHSLAVRTSGDVMTGGDHLSFEETYFHQMGEIVVDNANLLPQGRVFWRAIEPASIMFTNRATLAFYNFRSYYETVLGLRFSAGGRHNWLVGGPSNKGVTPSQIDVNWWDGPVSVEGTVHVIAQQNRYGACLRGKVSGSGSLVAESCWLHLQNPENDFSFDLSLIPSTYSSNYRGFERGLAVYANGALPLSCRGVAVTDGEVRLFDDARFDLPRFEYRVSGDTNVAFSSSASVEDGTLAALKKTGTGTLSYAVPLAVTGTVEVVEGVVDTDGKTLEAGVVVPGDGTIDGSVKVLKGIFCPADSVSGGVVRKLTVSGRVEFAERCRLDIDEIVGAGAITCWSEPNVLIEAAGGIVGAPEIDPDSIAARRHWRVSVSGGVLSVFRTYGTVFSIR